MLPKSTLKAETKLRFHGTHVSAMQPSIFSLWARRTGMLVLRWPRWLTWVPAQRFGGRRHCALFRTMTKSDRLWLLWEKKKIRLADIVAFVY